MTSYSARIPLTGPDIHQETRAPLTTLVFLKNLLALASVFWAGYLWLVLAA